MVLLEKKKQVQKNRALSGGVLETVFPGSKSKILDFLITFQDYDYSISDIATHSGVGFKTTLEILKTLEKQGVVNQERNVGRALMYKLNMNNLQAQSISKMVMSMAIEKIKEKNKK